MPNFIPRPPNPTQPTTVMHSCGHTSVHEIEMRGDSRERMMSRLGRGVCNACLAAPSPAFQDALSQVAKEGVATLEVWNRLSRLGMGMTTQEATLIRTMVGPISRLASFVLDTAKGEESSIQEILRRKRTLDSE